MSGPFRLLTVGLGSIGRRHLEAAGELGFAAAAVSRRPGVEAPGGARVFDDLARALDAFRPDGVLIATETARHGADLVALAAAGWRGPVLVEKPIAADRAELAAAPLDRFARVGCGYTLRFHPLLRGLRAGLAGSPPARLVSAFAGQHLPTWRPGTDFRAGYSASRAAGGGVLRDLSHELDYLIWLFGPVKSLTAQGGATGLLGIEADEAWQILMRFESGAFGALGLDYLARRAERWIAAQTPACEWRADFKANALTRDGLAVEALAPHEPGAPANRMYRAQLRAFAQDDPALATLAEALAVLDLIAAVETAAANRTWIDL